MPTITPSACSKILVTGGNGFLGMWIVQTLLDIGYSVRATVRTDGKSAYMKHYFVEHGDRFEPVILDDMTKEGAFDEAVKSVVGIIHTASPTPNDNPDPDAFIVPAVTVTRNLLQSVLKHGSSVKRVVHTSSTLAVTSETISREYTEKDWNEDALLAVQKEGFSTSRLMKYAASKVLAERAAWDMYEEHKSAATWDLVALCPPLIFGPPIQDASSLSTLNPFVKLFYDNVLSPDAKTKEMAMSTKCWVDVRDVAEAHVRALKPDNVGGERIIICAGSSVWQEWIDICSPGSGFPEIERTYKWWFDTSKSRRLLGMKYREMRQTAEDAVKEFKARGWI